MQRSVYEDTHAHCPGKQYTIKDGASNDASKLASARLWAIAGCYRLGGGSAWSDTTAHRAADSSVISHPPPVSPSSKACPKQRDETPAP